MDELIREDHDGVAWLYMNRPDVLNAISPDQRNRMIVELASISRSSSVGAVVISGKGRGFCSGADLRRDRDNEPIEAAEPIARVLREGAQRLISAIRECEKPVIAAVNGVAAGLGAHLVFACDLVVASTEASFIEVFVRRGLIPDAGGLYLLPRMVGIHKAKELMMLGERVEAVEAKRIGLVNVLVEPDELVAVARDWATRLSKGPGTSISLTKRLLNRSFDSTWMMMLDAEAIAAELNSHSEDFAEGLASFSEGRPPRFRQ